MDTNVLIKIKEEPVPSGFGTSTADGRISVSWLYMMAYCERKLYLEKVKGIRPAPTAAMSRGSAVHRGLEEEHQRKATMELSVREAMEKSIRERESFEGREVTVRGNSLYGRIDKIIFGPYRILIIDDKPGTYAYFGNKLQVWGYCLAFAQMHRPKLSIFGMLEQEDTGDIVWLEEFSKEHQNRVMESTSRISDILSEREEAKPTDNLRKCASCRLRPFCKGD